MANPKLEKAVRLGLQMANGCSTMDEAVKEMLECLELVIDVGTSPIKAAMPEQANMNSAYNQQLETARPAPVFADDVPKEALRDLAPIGGLKGEASKTRVYWEIEDLQNKILEESPGDMEIQVNAGGDKIMLYRGMMRESGDGAAPGIQLSYKPQNATREIPYPKQSFWVTTEIADVATAVGKMREQADSMYKMRPAVQTKPAVYKPPRFNVGGEVS